MTQFQKAPQCPPSTHAPRESHMLLCPCGRRAWPRVWILFLGASPSLLRAPTHTSARCQHLAATADMQQRELSSHPGSSLLCRSQWHRSSQCCEELPDDVSEPQGMSCFLTFTQVSGQPESMTQKERSEQAGWTVSALAKIIAKNSE